MGVWLHETRRGGHGAVTVLRMMQSGSTQWREVVVGGGAGHGGTSVNVAVFGQGGSSGVVGIGYGVGVMVGVMVQLSVFGFGLWAAPWGGGRASALVAMRLWGGEFGVSAYG